MTHTGFRLHPEKDADILADLAKYKDKTARLKEIYRKGLKFEKGIINTENWWKESPKPDGVYEMGALPVSPLFAPRFEGDKLTSIDLVSPQHIPGVGVVTGLKSPDTPPPDKIAIKVNNKKVEPKEQAKANILQGFD